MSTTLAMWEMHTFYKGISDHHTLLSTVTAVSSFYQACLRGLESQGRKSV